MEQNSSDVNISVKAGRREWIGLAVIALPCMLYSMDLTVLNLAIPFISADLNPSSSELLWIIDIYGFMVAGFLITMGNLGDRIGRRKLLLMGALAFGIASVVAAFSNSVEMLIATRAILGIAGGTLAPSTLSLIRNMFHDPKQRTVAIGIWITSYSVGGAAGPIIGGAVLQQFWWGAVFLIAVPVMVLLLILGPMLLPEYKDPKPGRLDLISALLSLIGVLSIIFGLKKIAEHGFSWLSAQAIFAGLVLWFIFLRRQKKLPTPMIDLRLFKSVSFSSALLIYTLTTFVMFGNFVFTFQYMQLIAELTPIQAGLWALPFFIAFVIGSQITPRLAIKFHPGVIMTAGLVLAALGFGLISMLNNNFSGFLLLIVGLFIYCLGLAPVFTLTTDIIISAAPPEKAGSASALSETGSEFGGALGIAILGSIGTAVYRTNISKGFPAGISNEMANSSRDNLANALKVAEQLPFHSNTLFADSATSAFVAGMKIVTLICMTLAIFLAFLSLKLIQRKTE